MVGADARPCLPVEMAEVLISFSDEINARRPLTDREVDAVCEALWIVGDRPRARAWRDEDDADLVRLTLAGALAPQAAIQLGRSVNAVRSRIKRLHRTRPGLLPNRANQFQAVASAAIVGVRQHG